MSDVHTSLGFRKAMNEDVVIIGGARTPFCEWVGGKRGDGKSGGALKTVSAQELGAIAIKGALEKTGTDASKVDHVVMGYALQTCSQSIYGARHAGLKAGIPQEVPMLTLSRICGSGIQSIVSGAQMIMLGEADTVVSGGMENLSQAPHILRGARDGWRLGRSPKVEDYMMTNLQDMTCGLFMAQTSDELCKRKGVSREEIDAFATLSHARTTASIDNDVFEQEIVPVTISSRRGDTVLTHKDEDHVVRGTT
jgi:acetyl-CoA acetyltransferase